MVGINITRGRNNGWKYYNTWIDVLNDPSISRQDRDDVRQFFEKYGFIDENKEGKK